MGKQTAINKNQLKLIYLILLILIPLKSLSENSADLFYQDLSINKKLIKSIIINPNKYKIINDTANSIQQNTASVDNLAKNHGAIAAVNGGFFRKINNNFFVPAGVLKVDNVWHGIAYQPRAAIGWNPNSNTVLIDRITTKSFVQLGSKLLPINYFNPHNTDNNQINNKVILYSNIYPNFEDLELKLNLSKNRQNFLITVNNTPTYIFNVNTNHPDILELQLSTIKLASVNIDIYPELQPNTKNLWNNMQFITSGSPVLIKNNQKISDYSAEKISPDFIDTPSPRTAICILNNGFWQFAVTQNITIPELADLMYSLNCKEAINLDGGGSSELYTSSTSSNTFNTSLINSDLLSIANTVTDAILILPDK